MNVDQIVKLKKISQQLRRSVIRELSAAGSGHSAGCLGFADVMAVLYFHAMQLDPENPNWEDRDIFVMSNGHYAPLLYATLAERGFFDKKELANLRKFGSRNNIQIGGDTEKVMPLGDLADKWRSFGWDAQEIDGHDHLAIIQAIDKAKNSRQPSVIIAHTIPGRGVDFMEYDYHWHGKSPNAEEAERALAQLSEGGGE